MTRRNPARGRRVAARVTLAVAVATMLTPAIPSSWSGLATPALQTTAEAQRSGDRRAIRLVFFDLCLTECQAGARCCGLGI